MLVCFVLFVFYNTCNIRSENIKYVFYKTLLPCREVLEVHHALPAAVEIRALNLNSIPLIGTLLACFQGPVVP